MKNENNEQKYLTLLEEIINQDNDIRNIIRFLEEAYVEDKEWVQNKVEYIYTNGNVDDFIKNIRNDIVNDFINNDLNVIDNLYTSVLKKIQSNIEKKNIENLIKKEIKDITNGDSQIIDDEVKQLVDIEKAIKMDDFYVDFYSKLKYKYFNYNLLIENWNIEKDKIIHEQQQINEILINIEENKEIIQIRNQIKLIDEEIRKTEIQLEKLKITNGPLVSQIRYTRSKNEINSEKIIKEFSLLEENSFNIEIEKITGLYNYLDNNYKNTTVYIWTELNYFTNDQQINMFKDIIIKTELSNIFKNYLIEKHKMLNEELNNECSNQLGIFTDVKEKYFNDESDSYYKIFKELEFSKNVDLVKADENINRLSNEYKNFQSIHIDVALEKVIDNITINSNCDESEFHNEANIIIKNIEIENFNKILTYNIISIKENNNNKLENLHQLYINLYEKIKQENRLRNIEQNNNHEKIYRIENGFFNWVLNDINRRYKYDEMYYEIQKMFEREFGNGFGYQQYTERELRIKLDKTRDKIVMRFSDKIGDRDEIDRIIKLIYQRMLSNSVNSIISNEKEDYLELKKDIIIEKLKLILNIYIYIKLREYLLNRDNEKIIELARKLKKEEYGWKEYGLSAYLNSRK